MNEPIYEPFFISEQTEADFGGTSNCKVSLSEIIQVFENHKELDEALYHFTVTKDDNSCLRTDNLEDDESKD